MASPTNLHRHRTRRRPTNHLGWTFTGQAEFEARASSFLAQGAPRKERLVYVADDPNLSQWPKVLLDRGDLLVLSTSEVYGSDRLVVPVPQRVLLESMIDEALRDGYTGTRICADNTSLIAGPERLEAWMQWEHEADQLAVTHQVIGLCSFDRTRADAESLQAALGAHRVIGPPAPKWE